MAGAPDFIGDSGTVKGNTDEGFVAPMAAGVIAACQHDQEGIAEHREMYRSRLRLLSDMWNGHGTQIAVEPAPGF